MKPLVNLGLNYENLFRKVKLLKAILYSLINTTKRGFLSIVWEMYFIFQLYQDGKFKLFLEYAQLIL